jgi:protein TonB
MTDAAERHLNWAFAIALLLHGAALLAAARLPAESARAADFDQLRVFRETAPVVVAPVDLVEWSPPAPASTRAEAALSPVATAKTQPPRPRALSRPRVTAREPNRTRSARVARQVASRPTRTGQGGGGGGGGPVDLGSLSPRGSGQGSGEGAGVGPGAGAGESTPGEPAPEPGFVSRVADRLEPEVVAKGTLDYPPSAAAEGVAGTVRLEVLVTETGSVADVQVTASSGDRRLDEAAREWVHRWRYRPAVQDGKPRRVYTHATVEFELR